MELGFVLCVVRRILATVVEGVTLQDRVWFDMREVMMGFNYD